MGERLGRRGDPAVGSHVHRCKQSQRHRGKRSHLCQNLGGQSTEYEHLQFGEYLTNRVGRFRRRLFPTFNLLPLFGFTSPCIFGLQRWLDRTGDIQTIAILACYFPLSRMSTSEQGVLRRWIEAYRTLLDSWSMWGARVDFDVRRMELGKALGETRVTEEDLGTSKGICPV